MGTRLTRTIRRQRRRRLLGVTLAGAMFVAGSMLGVAFADTLDVLSGDQSMSFGTLDPGDEVSDAASLTVSCTGNNHATRGALTFKAPTITLDTGSAGSASEVSAAPSVTIPSSWPADSNNCGNPKPADATGSALISVNVPSDAAAGSRSIQVKLESSDADVSNVVNIHVSYTVSSTPPPPPDTTNPVVTIAPGPGDTEAASGWYNIASSGTDGVDVVISASDNVGVTSLTCTNNGTAVTGLTNAGGTVNVGDGVHAFSCTAMDAANNEGTASRTFRVDQTVPVVDCDDESAPAAGAWQPNEVSIRCTADDGTGSGLAQAGDASFSLSTSVGEGNASNNASTGSRTVSDVAGNASAQAGPFGPFSVDRQNPTATIVAPSGSYILNAAVVADYSCDDGQGSGIASCVGDVADGANVDTSSVGAGKSFSVTATDNVGHRGQAGSTYSVIYAPSGTCLGSAGHSVLQPINVDGSSVFKKGSTVPVKFRVCDANGVSIGTPGVVSSFGITGRSVATADGVNEPVVSTTPDSAFRWDPADQQWIFNLSTKNLSAGVKYTYTIGLNDGSSIVFSFTTK